MTNESPAVILYDGNGNPVGTIIDGAFYRLQVEAKLAAGSNTIGNVGLTAGNTVGIDAGSNTIGNVGLNTGSNTIGNVGLTAGNAISLTAGNTIGLDAGANTIGNVGLTAGNSIALTAGNTVGLDAGVNTIGNVGLTAGNSIALTAGNTVGLDAGANTIGNVGLTAGNTIGIATGNNVIGNVGLEAGINSIGSVGLNTGSNTIGNVGLTSGTQVLIQGKSTLDNTNVNTKVTHDGYLNVVSMDPRMPFGALYTENLTPFVQGTPTYGLIPELHRTTISLSGTVTAASDLFTASTGVTQYSFGSFQSRDRAKYRPGQGLIARFSALYSSPVASSILVAGIGHAESGLYFGYNGTSFGILYVNQGVRGIISLTITTKSSHAENVTVTLNGTAFSIAVTNGANTIKTAYEISLGTYSGWTAVARGSIVVFLSNSAGVKNGVYSISGTSVIGSFVETTAGVASVDTWIPQTSWNGDKLDGTGNSGLTLDPSKGNNYQILIQSLGFGTITFGIESSSINNHNDYVNVHTLKTTNNVTMQSLNNSSYPFTMAAYSAGSITDVSLSSGAYSIFLSGIKKISNNRFTYSGSITTANATDYTCLFTIRNDIINNNRASQTVIDILSITAAVKHTQPCSLYLFRNATLAGTPNFTRYSASSGTYFDNAATTCTISDNSQLLLTLQLAETGNIIFTLSEQILLQADDTITLAAKSLTGTPSYISGSINTVEDQ